MKQLLLTTGILILTVFLNACAQKELEGNGKFTTQARTVTHYNALSVQGNFNVILTASPTNKLSVTTDSNLQNFIVTEVKNNTLYIKTKENQQLKSTQTPSISIYLPVITKINTSGEIKIDGRNISTHDLMVSAAGNNWIQLEGKVNNLSLSSSGAIKMNTVKMQANNISIQVNGSGQIKVLAENQLHVVINGDATVQYAGKPDVKQKISGSGSVESMQVLKN